MMEAWKPSYCQANSKKLFLCGGSVRETPPTLKKLQVASGATYSYNWNTHTLVKHRAMSVPKMYHTIALFLNSMYTVGG